MDRRVRKTQRAVTDAFDRLITRKRYGKISVQDIIDEADIGRSTFYEHFETKDDVLRMKCSALFGHVFAPPSDERAHNFAGETSFERRVTHILLHLLDDRRVTAGILRSESSEIFMGYFRAHMNELVRSELDVAAEGEERAFMFDHIVDSFIAAVRRWFDRDLRVSPERLAAYYVKAVSPVIARSPSDRDARKE